MTQHTRTQTRPAPAHLAIDVSSAEAVQASIIADPELWARTILPAIAEGVLDAAEWLTWNRADGVSWAFELTDKLWLQERISQWRE